MLATLATTSTAEAIDDVLAGTFPASDPPAWTSSIVRPAPELAGRSVDPKTTDDETSDRRSDSIDVSRAD